MISTENNITTVQFASIDNKGKIGVQVNGLEIQLQELVSEIPVGERFEKEDVNDLPKVLLEFSNIKSVDVMIKALQDIKKNWTNYYQFALAC